MGVKYVHIGPETTVKVRKIMQPLTSSHLVITQFTQAEILTSEAGQDVSHIRD